jgi:uncharacterized protein involved in exopolysaccharide biosynthesis
MNAQAVIDQTSSKEERWFRYLVLILLLNSAIWGLTVFYLKYAKPTYTSEWAITLPGSAPGIDINLPNIGQASSSSNSPFGGATTDPRANYQFIAMSDVVLNKAATAVHETENEFGKPRIKLIDNTTIMTVQVQGGSPEQAQRRAAALYEALTKRLTLLRIEEVARRDEGIEETLQSARGKLATAQQRLSVYKVNSGLSFPGQIDNLSVNVEQLRRQRTEILVQANQATSRSQQLSATLGISSQQAAEAFLLQTDQQFQQNLKTYSETTANLAVLRSKWGRNHPEIVRETAKQDTSDLALRDRSTALLGREIGQQALSTLSLSVGDGGGRASLFRDLITVQAEQQGLAEAVRTLDQQIASLDNRLGDLSYKQSKLESLERDMQTAEAVFASTVAKLDLGKSEIFSAYPLAQLVADPSLPQEASAPRRSLVLAGSLVGSLFCTAGLGLLWWRKRLIEIMQSPAENTVSADTARVALPPKDEEQTV